MKIASFICLQNNKEIKKNSFDLPVSRYLWADPIPTSDRNGHEVFDWLSKYDIMAAIIKLVLDFEWA